MAGPHCWGFSPSLEGGSIRSGRGERVRGWALVGLGPEASIPALPNCNPQPASRIKSHVLHGCPPDLRSIRLTPTLTTPPRACLPKIDNIFPTFRFPPGSTGILRLGKVIPEFTLQNHLNISHAKFAPASDGEW